ncbi:MAG: DEAD/DEAH box helicase [Lentimicrobium sp.]|jgi:ATP-independent RNA helicase DbpA|nr:DEAD/DEAH box helicase [Lentimicrobium sp.]
MLKPYLENLGITTLNPMQMQAIAEITPGKSAVLIAPTGSGKTLAFLLPLIEMIDPDVHEVQALILAPSRELALQIEDVFKKMKTGIKVNVCYGGHPVKTEVNNFRQPPPVLVGTPGRIADHIRRSNFNATHIHTLVLDEFDKSLELGFSKEMEYICRNLPLVRTRALTSATLLKEVPGYVGLSHPVSLDYSIGEPSQKLDVAVVRAETSDKLDVLFHLLCAFRSEPALIFCNHREAVERISNLLKVKGIVHGTYHGGLDQDERELSLIRFRNGTHQTLLTTDLGSRGLDIPEVRHVVHYQLPGSETIWIHRNGRTARMHASGKSWLVLADGDYVPTFVSPAPQEVNLEDCGKLPELPPWETIYLGAGKKQKVSKADILGFFIKQGGLAVQEIGRIDVLDNASFVAIKREKCIASISILNGIRLKKKMVKIDFAR